MKVDPFFSSGSKHKAKLKSMASSSSSSSEPTKPASPTPIDLNDLPGCVFRNEEGFKCKTCDKQVNSESQLQQHLNSKRHLSMESGIPCDEKLSKEERRYKPYTTAAVPKFKQKRSNTADADSWKRSQNPSS